MTLSGSGHGAGVPWYPQVTPRIVLANLPTITVGTIAALLSTIAIAGRSVAGQHCHGGDAIVPDTNLDIRVVESLVDNIAQDPSGYLAKIKARICLLVLILLLIVPIIIDSSEDLSEIYSNWGKTTSFNDNHSIGSTYIVGLRL